MNTQLNELSHALLRLHKALLDAERLSYERVHGRIESNGAFLQLVLGDSWFAWLRPLSNSMAKLDELAETDTATSADEIASVLASVRSLLTPSETGEGFSRHYYDALQQAPDVGLAHAQVKRVLGSRSTPQGGPS
ncbi:MAG TPA: hypothetical protein PKD12_00915 [Nitrospira sp.]|nr:hypothetical protein [Nitrospira sp.]